MRGGRTRVRQGVHQHAAYTVEVPPRWNGELALWAHGFRGETAQTEQMRRRIDLDIWYINNWSLLTDIRILVRTAFTLLKHDAY